MMVKPRAKSSPIWKISEEELKKLVDSCQTMTEVLSKFGLNNKGGNHKTLQAKLDYHKIDCEKFKNYHSVRRVCKSKRLLEDVLVVNSTYSRCVLKARLIKEGLLDNSCSNCKCSPIWDGKPLVLILDHINGIGDDHRMQNLRLLCPNCNSQTDTFAGRNTKRSKVRYNCPKCGVRINKYSKTCRKCVTAKRKNKRPSKEELKSLLWEKTGLEIGKMFGVNSTMIPRWAKYYGLEVPGRGYWAKLRSEELKQQADGKV